MLISIDRSIDRSIDVRSSFARPEPTLTRAPCFVLRAPCFAHSLAHCVIVRRAHPAGPDVVGSDRGGGLRDARSAQGDLSEGVRFHAQLDGDCPVFVAGRVHPPVDPSQLSPEDHVGVLRLLGSRLRATAAEDDAEVGTRGEIHRALRFRAGVESVCGGKPLDPPAAGGQQHVVPEPDEPLASHGAGL